MLWPHREQARSYIGFAVFASQALNFRHKKAVPVLLREHGFFYCVLLVNSVGQAFGHNQIYNFLGSDFDGSASRREQYADEARTVKWRIVSDAEPDPLAPGMRKRRFSRCSCGSQLILLSVTSSSLLHPVHLLAAH